MTGYELSVSTPCLVCGVSFRTKVVRDDNPLRTFTVLVRHRDHECVQLVTEEMVVSSDGDVILYVVDQVAREVALSTCFVEPAVPVRTPA